MKFGYWERRSKLYNEQKWVKNEGYLKEFIKYGRFQKNEVVLDVGTGTGIVAKAIAPLVKQVIAIDISNSMLKKAKEQKSSFNL